MIIEITNKASTCPLKFRSVDINLVQYFQSAFCRGDARPCLRKSVKKLTVVFLLSINAYITVNKVKNIPDNPKKTLYDIEYHSCIRLIILLSYFITQEACDNVT